MPHVRPAAATTVPTPPRPLSISSTEPVIELVAVVVAVFDDEPRVCVVASEQGDKLPSASFSLDDDATLEECLRAGVSRETDLNLGYVDQLQCVAMRPNGNGEDTGRLVIGYLTLAHGADHATNVGRAWRSWYHFLPWEDWRRGRPQILRELIEPHLREWADEQPMSHGMSSEMKLTRLERIRLGFGLDGIGWDEERVLERFDLLDEAGILARDVGQKLAGDHRRTLAAAIGRLRGKIKSRPVVFELMPERFTLFELQRTVEAILGPHLHKQNFRRLVEHMGLVEPTEGIKSHTGGRPAKLFRFRHSVLLERLQPGVRVRTMRG